MGDKPINFKGPMVRALLDGRKTQTRRVLKPQPFPVGGPFYRPFPHTDPRQWYSISSAGLVANIQTVAHAPGDRLWVREGHALVPTSAYRMSDGVMQAVNPDDRDRACVYREGWDRSKPGKWRSPIHMPRWASRLTLIVTDVRVQRLQEISEEDAVAEGATMRPKCHGWRNLDEGWSMDWSRIGVLSRYASVPPGSPKMNPLKASDISLGDPQMAFASFWNDIHGPDAWYANPWVAAISFDVKRGNIDAVLA